MDSMNSFMDIIIFGSGVYILYVYYMLKFKKEIKETLLLPKDLPVNKCKDKEGYIAYMSPKVLILGIITLICACFGISESQFHLLGNWYIAVLAVLLAAVIWFIIVSKKATKKYWP